LHGNITLRELGFPLDTGLNMTTLKMSHFMSIKGMSPEHLDSTMSISRDADKFVLNRAALIAGPLVHCFD
jgi:hypothetical protein